MFAHKKPVNAGKLMQSCRDPLSELNHVLRILQDWQPLTMLVGSNAIESFQHFVALKSYTTL